MVNTIDMQNMRYLNLFEKITGIRTRFCFDYNNYLMFCVPQPMISRAVGRRGENIKKIQDILGKRIKIVPVPKDSGDAELLIKSIVNPVTIGDVEVTENEIIVSGGRNKAALIGRNKRRMIEMEKVTQGFFGKEFRIV